MARSSKLEGRIVALLDRARSHHPITVRLSLGLVLAAALLLTVAAVLQPVARAAVVAESGEQPAKGTVEKSARLRSGRRKWSRRPARRNRSGDASSDPRDDPVRGAQECGPSEASARIGSGNWWRRPMRRAASSASKSTPPRLPNLKSSEALSLRNHHKVPIALAASAAGFGFGLIELAGLGPAKREELANVSFRLVKDVPVSGRILTMDGRPASGTSSRGGRDQINRARRRWTNTFALGTSGGRSTDGGTIPDCRRPREHAAGSGCKDVNRSRTAELSQSADWEPIASRCPMLRGPSTPQSVIVVITRPVPPGEAERTAVGEIRLTNEPGDRSRYYAKFTFVSEATPTILRGVVRDRQTGRPVPACTTSGSSRSLP